MLERGYEGLLNGLLGQVEVTGGADQAGDDPARFLAEDTVDGIERERSTASEAADARRISQRRSRRRLPLHPGRCPGSPRRAGPRSCRAERRGSLPPT